MPSEDRAMDFVVLEVLMHDMTEVAITAVKSNSQSSAVIDGSA